MARQWRIEFEGALYHILSRGNQQQDIFLGDEDRNCFLDILSAMSERFAVDIFAYVLMDNHYHILLRTQKPNLSKSMQWMGTTYTRRFNLNHFRSGHLFQGRYKSIIVENDAYLLRLSYYIHRNPLRAGLVERLADYPWSSYSAYAYKKKCPEWLKTNVILKQYDAKDKRRAYRQKVQKYSDEKNRIWEDVRHGLIYGSQNFIDKDNRDLLIYLLWETGMHTNREIGELFGLTYSSISRRGNIAKERLKKKGNLDKKYKQLKSLIKV